MIRQSGKFSAVGDDGHEYIVLIYTDIIDVGHLVDPTATIKGLKSLQTVDGMAVNRREKGEYEIVETGVILRSSAADAP